MQRGEVTLGLSITVCLGIFVPQSFVCCLLLLLVGVCSARVCPQWALRGTNDNQLIIFLIANVCVGAVNLSIRTLLQPAFVVWAIMTAYMLFLFVCAHRFGVEQKRIKIL